MLPRLRFVVAAAVIAILPMLLLGSGFVMTAHDAHVSELAHLGGRLMSAADENRNAQQLQVLAYARRSSELDRLRELASIPLRTWVAAPTGADSAAEEVAPPQITADPEPQAETVANLPPMPATESDARPNEPASSTEEAAGMSMPAVDEAARPDARPAAPAKPKTAQKTRRKRGPSAAARAARRRVASTPLAPANPLSGFFGGTQ